MRPIPTADGFSLGPQGSENTAMGRTPASDNKQSDNKQSDNKQTRRRGAELESAILNAVGSS